MTYNFYDIKKQAIKKLATYLGFNATETTPKPYSNFALTPDFYNSRLDNNSRQKPTSGGFPS